MIIIFGKKMSQNVSHISNEGRHLIVIYKNFSICIEKNNYNTKTRAKT